MFVFSNRPCRRTTSVLARVLLLFLFSSWSASASASTSADASAGVSLSLDEFKELFRQARLNTEERNFEKMRTALRDQFDEESAKKERRQKEEEKKQRERALDPTGGAEGKNWALLAHSASGKYKVPKAASNIMGAAEPTDGPQLGMAEFQFEMHFHVFENVWTAIPLLDAEAVVQDWQTLRLRTSKSDAPSNSNSNMTSVSGKNSAAPGSSQAVRVWEGLKVGPSSQLVVQARRKFRKDQDGDDNEKYDYTFITNVAGSYKLRFKLLSWVQNNRNLLGLSLTLQYPLTSTTLELESEDGSGFKHMTLRQLSVEPAAATEIEELQDRLKLKLALPATKKLTIQWRMAAKGKGAPEPANKRPEERASDAAILAEDEEPAAPPQAVAQHDALHSIGESVIVSENTLKLTLDSEERALSHVSLLLPARVRVTSVVAHGMLTWRTVAAKSGKEGATPSEASSEESQHADGGRSAAEQSSEPMASLIVVLKSSTVTKEVIVVLTTELELPDSSQTRSMIELPRILCQNVLRQTGTIAVVKDAGVEVHEHALQGAVSRASPADIPQHVLAKTARPVVMAYRFLSPRHSLVVSLLHHEELQTLE